MTRFERKSTEIAKGQTCPICQAQARRRDRPFCSARCADIDLGRWLTERYALPGEAPAAVLDTSHSDDIGPSRKA